MIPLLMAFANDSTSSVPPARLAALQTGINLSHWYAQTMEDYGDKHLTTYFQESDRQLIKKIGFKHVRYTLNPAALNGSNAPSDAIRPERLKMFGDQVDAFVKAGIAVIVDIHPDDSFKEALRDDPRMVAAFEGFWSKLATEMAKRDPNKVFLEVLNEPAVMKGDKWRGIESRLVGAIRKAAPKHTIIVNPGGEWSSIDRLVEGEPYADKNLIYTFHCYDPFVFTHQGAEWGWDKSRFMKQVPYPSSPEAVEPLLGTIQDQDAMWAVKNYGGENWDFAKMKARLKLAADWGAKHKVPVYCGEFGAYATFSPRESRLTWIRDTTRAMRELGIGWAMWDYAGGFAVAVGERGKRTADADVVKALGL
ncbi:MAG: glycoside hydrolase family 5 protein [Armatimonadetes bacterium]|nr:glycoside hydrolase family 5 protein [Armatimonadota bacterium]